MKVDNATQQQAKQQKMTKKTQSTSLDVMKIRQDFPILHQEVHGKPLVYLDNAATTQKPQAVIDTIMRVYSHDNSNVHRGIHTLSERATALYEAARDTVKNHINARESREIIFVRGTTEAINLVATGYGQSEIQAGDEIIISEMEHHSNIVPWQMLCERTGAILRVIPINEHGEIILEEYQKLLNTKTKLVAVVHISNALGTINPVADMITLAHEHNIPVLIDGAQALPHCGVDVQALDCDFYTFSGHKTFAPSGIGVLYGKAELLEKLPPYQGGGEMISSVSFDKTTYNVIPHKFEAGTPNISGAIALATALDYLNNLGIENIAQYEKELLNYATDALLTIPGLRLIGTAKDKASILSFTLDDIHAHDVGTILDFEGIAIRSGHHCAMPIMEHFKVPATSRASLSFYNTKEEINKLVAGLHRAKEVFKR